MTTRAALRHVMAPDLHHAVLLMKTSILGEINWISAQSLELPVKKNIAFVKMKSKTCFN